MVTPVTSSVCSKALIFLVSLNSLVVIVRTSGEDGPGAILGAGMKKFGFKCVKMVLEIKGTKYESYVIA